jgi:hypothetical protein
VAYWVRSHDIAKTLDEAIWERPGVKRRKMISEDGGGSEGEEHTEQKKKGDDNIELSLPKKRGCFEDKEVSAFLSLSS